MESFFDKLGLRPAERRLVVGSGVILFIVLNVYVIWPHFNDWKELRKEISDAEATIALYQEESARIGEYQSKEAELEITGVKIPSAKMAISLLQTVETKIQRSGIGRRSTTPSRGSGNGNDEFFEEHQITVTYGDTKDEDLLKFLVSLGTGESVIRVRAMTISPERTQMKLRGSITMVASFQKERPGSK